MSEPNEAVEMLTSTAADSMLIENELRRIHARIRAIGTNLAKRSLGNAFRASGMLEIKAVEMLDQTLALANRIKEELDQERKKTTEVRR